MSARAGVDERTVLSPELLAGMKADAEDAIRGERGQVVRATSKLGLAEDVLALLAELVTLKDALERADAALGVVATWGGRGTAAACRAYSDAPLTVYTFAAAAREALGRQA